MIKQKSELRSFVVMLSVRVFGMNFPSTFDNNQHLKRNNANHPTKQESRDVYFLPPAGHQSCVSITDAANPFFPTTFSFNVA